VTKIKEHTADIFDTTRKGNPSSFLTPTAISGWCPLARKIYAQSDPPPQKRRFRQISGRDVSTARAIEKRSIITNRKSTTGFPTSYTWAMYVTLKSQRVARIKEVNLLFLLIKLDFYRIKTAAKFFCVETSSGRVVVMSFPYQTVNRCWRKTQSFIIIFHPKLTYQSKSVDWLRSYSDYSATNTKAREEVQVSV